jgi:hypothetical protein
MFIKGTHRYVFVIGSLVFKIPRVRILSWIWNVISYDTWKEKLRDPLYLNWGTFSHFVFEGIKENYVEAFCFFQTRHRILAKLFLPLLFVNIYKRDRNVGNFRFDSYLLGTKIEASGNQRLLATYKCSGHTFDNRNNFAGNGKYVRILDYGDSNIHVLIREHGDQLEEILLTIYDPTL